MKNLYEVSPGSRTLAEAMMPEPVKKRSPKPVPVISSTLGLAQHLGLSEWTVSRAINGHPEVKAATRERILQAMQDVGFRPNPVARGLNGKGMGIIGVCFGNTQNSIMIDMVTLMDKFLREHQLRAILAISPKDEEGEIRILEDFRHLRVDGIVLIQSYLGSAQLSKVLKGIPCVHVDPADSNLVPSVSLDRHEAMHQEVTHLLEMGHRSFAVLGFSRANRWRWDGLADAVKSFGLDPEKDVETFELESPGNESYPEGMKLTAMALASKKRATAFIAVNDRVAEAAIQKLQDAGLRVPQDVSVVGFNNLPMGEHLRPTLTTIDQQPHKLVAHARDLLLEQLADKTKIATAKTIKVDPLLILRESSGPALGGRCKVL